MACFRLTPAVRRVSARTRLTSRASACGAIRRRGSAALVKLKPRNVRAAGRATALFALLTFSLRRPVRKRSTLAMTRSPALHIDIAVIGVADEAMTAPLQFLVQYVQHQVRQQRRERTALRRPLVGRPDQPHQQVVVDPVEELLQVDV